MIPAVVLGISKNISVGLLTDSTIKPDNTRPLTGTSELYFSLNVELTRFNLEVSAAKLRFE
jgi:hypothetical protein